MVDVRFATALQLLLTLARAQRRGVHVMTSSALADALGANPSLVRKLVVALAHERLVSSTMGAYGGVSLAKPEERITLADIYSVFFREKAMFEVRRGVPNRCIVSANIDTVIEEIECEVLDAMCAKLEARTLTHVLDGLARFGPIC